MSPARRQIVFINTAHSLTHYSLLILPTAVLAMAVKGGAFGSAYGPILALATGMFVCYGLFSLPQGWLVARLRAQGADGGVLLRHRRCRWWPPAASPTPRRWRSRWPPPACSPRSTTRSAPRCWWNPQAKNPAARSG